jgi:hypothetical protein
MIPFDPTDVWSWTSGATPPPDETQATLRGMTISGGVQGRGHPVIGVGDPRGGSFSPGNTRRTL